MTMDDLEHRVVRYWTARSHDFGAVRKNELGSAMGRRWLEELENHLPKDRTLDILEEASALAEHLGLAITFRQMDAQNLDFPDESFDVVLSRNLTWTLPEPERAYAQWYRVLRPCGLLLNFDADYAENIRSESTQNCSVAPDSPYGHVGMTEALVEENNAITLAMDLGQKRPAWDEKILRKTGFTVCRTDLTLGRRVLGEADLVNAPMFGILAQK